MLPRFPELILCYSNFQVFDDNYTPPNSLTLPQKYVLHLDSTFSVLSYSLVYILEKNTVCRINFGYNMYFIISLVYNKCVYYAQAC